ncbi:class I SAM-dependent methyltransferase [Candidatus Aminicenantes bacterium AC-335-A11]|jgi:SAM-dependent methyltransferase|nr:class I SAM-dependent methyltransferase [SCandidatus Aminicenantes bacterium Aminicenantia_JdfR_composite]MCP2617927.1 class I SAM-dependent methyltransferase [Candidatus Aminicenantes bacterium AC-335-A11]
MSEGTKNHIFGREEVEKYERKRYKGLDQKIVNWREKSIVQKILKNISEENFSILDIPCGYGRFINILENNGNKIFASDLSFSMVEKAREKNYKNFYFVSNLKLGIPIKSNTIDCVFCFRFFHHLHYREERVKVLKELERISKKWIIISCYIENKIHSIQRKIRKKLMKKKTKIKIISLEDLESEVNYAKLKIIKIFPVLKGIHSQHIILLKKATNGSSM